MGCLRGTLSHEPDGAAEKSNTSGERNSAWHIFKIRFGISPLQFKAVGLARRGVEFVLVRRLLPGILELQD